ncbi:MAG TPA: hypothetical protein VFC46_08635 [Humisphaera sp.]|nr:hypothetical protein [Humisphaera sp.]
MEATNVGWKDIEEMPHRIFAGKWLRVRNYGWSRSQAVRLELLTETGWENLHDLPYDVNGTPILCDVANDESTQAAIARSKEMAIGRCKSYAQKLLSLSRSNVCCSSG